MEKTLGEFIIGSITETLKLKPVRNCPLCGEALPSGSDFCEDICPDYSIFKTKEEQ